ncbi:DUF2190 family protein [Rubritepida flocculans]|uniref:DUF2190 family protein n=1 Tax=Rubritepida flocculans TaxID=182403 RepID=UPI000A024249|nr:DUF2190 family protein [Rubritepida flocculans]
MRNCLRPDARSIPMVVPYTGGILAGQGLLVGAFFGVAASDAAQNATVECETRGEFELPKEPALAITQGARVFWDDANRRITTTAIGSSPHAASPAVRALSGPALHLSRYQSTSMIDALRCAPARSRTSRTTTTSPSATGRFQSVAPERRLRALSTLA